MVNANEGKFNLAGFIIENKTIGRIILIKNSGADFEKTLDFVEHKNIKMI
ncbi:MAG: hypothetical protein QXM68_03300 [Candidatus Aenigmatarchaeota archaeon]|nr:hypothetical protein [Candidatus Aenigmarchaeota archaeon]